MGREKASVFVGDADSAWIVTETPSEVEARVLESEREDPLGFVELTLANLSSWGGKLLRIRARDVTCIAPPRYIEEEDDD